MMGDIRKTAISLEIPYYPVSSAPNPSKTDIEKYAQKLGFEDCFYWASGSPLSQVITPSHILVGKDGIILHVWFGSNQNEDVRKRISYQISSDLLLIHDVFQSSQTD